MYKGKLIRLFQIRDLQRREGQKYIMVCVRREHMPPTQTHTFIQKNKIKKIKGMGCDPKADHLDLNKQCRAVSLWIWDL